jgi:hypothetical protein
MIRSSGFFHSFIWFIITALIIFLSGCNLFFSLFDTRGEIVVSPAQINMATFAEAQVRAYFVSENGENEDITDTASWVSSNSALVTIVKPGLVMAQASALGATVMIAATKGNSHSNCTVRITSAGVSPSPSPDPTAVPTASPTPAPDFIPPVPGNGGAITVTGVTDSTITIVWTRADDPPNPQTSLDYRVLVNGVPSSWMNDADTTSMVGLSPSTSYNINVEVRDPGMNVIPYNQITQSTSAGMPDIQIEQSSTVYMINDLFDFGVAAIGESLPVTFTVKNIGTAPLHLWPSPVSITGIDFTVNQSALIAATTLTTGQTRTFDIVFTPSGEGFISGTLHLASDAPGKSPYNVNLKGTGGMPTIVVSGGGTLVTSKYNPRLNAFQFGPAIPGTTPGPGIGANSFTAGSPMTGKRVLVYGNGSDKSAIYDSGTGTFAVGPIAPFVFGAGSTNFPTLSNKTAVLIGGGTINVVAFNPGIVQFESWTPVSTIPGPGVGGHSFTLSNGNSVIVYGNSLQSYDIYDAAMQTYTLNNLSINASVGANSFKASGDCFVTITGGGLTTAYYFSSGSYIATLYLSGASGAGAGSHSFEIHSGPWAGKIIVIHGNDTPYTSIYDPSSPPGSFAYGPQLKANAGAGSNSFLIKEGMYAGMVLVVHGGGLQSTSIFNPSIPDFIVGPPLNSFAGEGSLNFSGK